MPSTTIWLNEVNYFSAAANSDYLEIALPIEGGFQPAFSVAVYDGSGNVVQTIDVPEDASATNGIAFIKLDGLELPDGGVGIALIRDDGSVREFLSFGIGAVTALDGPAVGRTSIATGVSDSDQNTGIGLTGTAAGSDGWTWTAGLAATAGGGLNPGQIHSPSVTPGAPISGDAGNNRMIGTTAGDSLSGLGGNDALIGLAGNDTLSGGDGNDFLFGGEGADSLDGGAGTDTATYLSSTSAVTLDLVSGIHSGDAQGDTFANIESFALTDFGDSVVADDGGIAGSYNLGGGNDTFTGGSTGDYVLAGDGDDSIVGGAGADSLLGQGGNDIIMGYHGNDTIRGVEGNDSLYGLVANDSLSGGEGDDYLDGGNNDDTLNGDAGNDTLEGGTGTDRLVGGDGDDVMNGGAGDDELFGLADDDRLTGGNGVDDLDGGDGFDIVDYGLDGGAAGVLVNLTAQTATDSFGNNETLTSIEGAAGTAQSDVLYGSISSAVSLSGGAGDDEVWGYATSGDTLEGGDGTNLLAATGGTSLVTGGSGTDYILTSYGSNTVDAGGGNDQVFVRYGTNEINLGDGYNLVLSMDLYETAPGEYFADSYDTVNGGSSDDYIYAGRGEDVLNGNAGNDWLAGGEWADTMTGGAGSDRFIFVDEAGYDVITDFQANGEDFLDFTTSTIVNDYSDLLVVQSGADLFVGWNNGQSGVTLQNVSFGDFSAADVLV